MRLTSILLLFAAAVMGCTPDTTPVPAERAAVLASGPFRVYNDFDTNLHDFLYWHGQRFPPADTVNACLQGAKPDDRANWDAAVDWYVAHISRRHHRTDPVILAIRHRNANLADAPTADSDTLRRTLDLLEAAAPVYSACWWNDHRARNQAWIDRLESLLEVYADSLTRRITGSLGLSFSTVVPVDVVGYASWSGANTIADPDHILMSSVNEGYRGYHSLEMVFHEVSHTLIGGDYGPVVEALEDAARKRTGREIRIPRDLWHPILFYTAGFHTADLLAAAGVTDFEMYMMEGRGVYSEAHPYLIEHWRPYLEGRIDLETAADDLMEALDEDGHL